MMNRNVEYPGAPVGSSFTPEEQHVLDKVNQRIAAGNTLTEVMDFLFEMTHVVCAWDRLSIAFVEEDGQRLRSSWTRAKYADLSLKSGYNEDLRGSSLVPIIESGKLRIINDLEAYLEVNPKSRSTRVLLREGVRSNLTCPLQVDGRSVGVFFRSSRQPKAFGEREVALHLAIAERLSQSVEKAWRIQQLEAANHSYIELLGFVSHELKSPLAALISSGHLLADGYLGELEPKQLERVQRMMRQSDYLMGIVKEYLDLARIESGDVKSNFRDVDLRKDVLDPSLELVEELANEKKITVEADLPPVGTSVECDPELIKVVLVNLLSNGIKYGVDDGVLRFHATSKGDEFTVSVWNRGPGFAANERNKLFRKFSRLSSPELMKRKGTGVGLYNAWKIVQLHGGRISAASQEGEWAEFTVRIPQPIQPAG